MKKNYSAGQLTKRSLTLSFIIGVLFVFSAIAQKNISWTGATNSTWSVASNWNYPAITIAATCERAKTILTLSNASSEIAVGDKVEGAVIAAGTTITAIDATRRIITLSTNTTDGVGSTGTNIVFTFATPRVATGAPGPADIAVISNGANLTLQSTDIIFLGGLTVSNASGAITGSTLTIPAGAEVFIESQTNEAVLFKGGNIINNGILDIINTTTTGNNHYSGAYGMTFSRPAVVPSAPVEYMYSGSGSLVIDSSSGSAFSGGILFNGNGINADNATNKILFDGTTTFKLSKATVADGTANTHVLRHHGSGSTPSCKIIIGGKGFNLGDAEDRSVNGLLGIANPGMNLTISPETTINVITSGSCGMAIIGCYAYGSRTLPTNFTNKGTINIAGVSRSNAVSIAIDADHIFNFVNEGVFNVSMTYVLPLRAAIEIVGYNPGFPTTTSILNVINSGTMTLTNPTGYALYRYDWNNNIPFFTVDNSGTMNLTGGIYNFGWRPIVATSTQPGSALINSGTINTNQEFRGFDSTNTNTGTINFVGGTQKLVGFTVLNTVSAAIGTTYTDTNANIYTVVTNKIAGTGTFLVTTAAINTNHVVQPASLTKTGSGSGTTTVAYTNITTNNNNNALFQRTTNNGTINTNTGTTAMTGITGITTTTATSVLSPGGDNGKGIVFYENLESDILELKGTLKMQVSGSTAAGIDHDVLIMKGGLDNIDLTALTLDLTGLYTPTESIIIDIIITSTTLDFEGGIIGNFASVIGLSKGWKVNYVEGIAGKVQLEFDLAALANAQFDIAKFNFYPNPAKNQLNVTAAKNISKVALYNVLGQKVQSHTINATAKQLDLSSLQNGLYIMEVTIDNATESFKVFKQ